MSSEPLPWIVLQMGAREHYAIPRALHRAGLLRTLLTDLWVPPSSPLARLPGTERLRGRFHRELALGRVAADNLRHLLLEATALPPTDRGSWSRTIARNRLLQNWASGQLIRQAGPCRLFAYSYAALEPLARAQQRGWRTVLGQIDPGPEEELIVAEEHRRYGSLLPSRWRPAPAEYWRDWRQEVCLADRIVVNSLWSRSCLLRQGVSERKLVVLPLVFQEESVAEMEDPASGRGRMRLQGEPFELLFLGTLCLRKGIGRLLEAMRLLEGRPVRLTLAGPTELDPVAWRDRRNIRWLGAVPRSAVGSLYRAADAMILPTLSDGFAITQLEALAHGCPLIVSRRCGDVVSENRNGWVLGDLEPPTLAAAILRAAQGVAHLPRPLATPAFTHADLTSALLSLSFVSA